MYMYPLNLHRKHTRCQGNVCSYLSNITVESSAVQTLTGNLQRSTTAAMSSLPPLQLTTAKNPRFTSSILAIKSLPTHTHTSCLCPAPSPRPSCHCHWR